MTEQSTPYAKRIWPILRWILLAILSVILIGSMITINETHIHKSFWDWLDLLIIPAVLGLGALWINQIAQQNEQRRADRENQIEREIASDRNQEAVLHDYLDRMTDLLLREDLRNSESDAEVRTVARTWTLTVLRSLVPDRKRAVVHFLIEAGLVSVDFKQQKKSEPIVSLQGANLREVKLRGVSLSRSLLQGAKLTNADLFRANLWGANLDGANLTGTTLPDGTTWTPDTDMTRFTDSDHPDFWRAQPQPDSPSPPSGEGAGG